MVKKFWWRYLLSLEVAFADIKTRFSQERGWLGLLTLRTIPKGVIEHEVNKINELNQCLIEKWDHVMPLPAYIHNQLLDEDQFAWDNYDSLWIPSILKGPFRCCSFPKHPRTSKDTLCHSCKKHGNREVLSFTRWIHNWHRNRIST